MEAQKKIFSASRDARLDVLVAEVCSISRSQAARLIEQGMVLVSEKTCRKAGAAVRQEMPVTVLIPPVKELDVPKQNLPLTILYEDDDVAVVDKPCGMVVHPAAGNESGTLVNALLFHLDHLSGIGGVMRPGIVHRLDKDTSGLMMVAKNDRAHQALSEQLKARTMEKHYLAVVEGHLKEQQGFVDLPIARSRKDRKKMAVDEEGRDARTEWRLVEELKEASLLDVHILTGRTHQIRVHMAALHHPVAGDPIYGFASGVKVPRLMLHAFTLCFDHPATGKRMRFCAPPPTDFQETVEKMRTNRGTNLWCSSFQSPDDMVY